MPAVTKALAAAAFVLATTRTLCAADYDPPVGPSPAQPFRQFASKFKAQGTAPAQSRSRDYNAPVAMEAPDRFAADMLAPYDAYGPIEAPLEEAMEPSIEEPMDAPLQPMDAPLGRGPAAAVPVREGHSGGPPAPGPEDVNAEVEEGDLRLVRSRVVGNSGYVVGALQVFVGGAFGAVCGTRFDSADASVACRQLGFVGGRAVDVADVLNTLSLDLVRDADVIAPSVLENLNCTGSEERLVDCPVATETGLDEYLQDEYSTYRYIDSFGACGSLDRFGYAAVLCGSVSGPEDSELRLTQGGESDDGSVQSGALEMFDLRTGGWNRICNAVLTIGEFQRIERLPLPDAAVTVACRQLGFEGGSKAILNVGESEYDGQPSFPLIADGTNCTGVETSLSQCPTGTPGNTIECDVFPDLAIECFASSIVSPGMGDGDLRLMDGQAGPSFEYGRLEIFLRGLWRKICDKQGFSPDSAAVACSALGFDGGSVLDFGYPVLPSSLPVGLAFVDCDGNETSLLDCSFLSTYNEITNARGGAGNSCGSSDSTILACGQTSGDCPAPAPAMEGSVRLVGGFGTPCDPLHSGFVEVFHDGEWGSICNGRNRRVAGAVCRQLGFPHGTVTDARVVDPEGDYQVDLTMEESEAPPERFWLSDVFCAGPENRLVDCDLGLGFRDDNSGCTRSPRALSVACRSFAVEAALEAVTTPGAEEGDVRLVEMSAVDNWQLGRLELFFEGSWGPVCSTGFTGLDATVACRGLGLGAGAVTPLTPEGTFLQTRINNPDLTAVLRPSGPFVFPAVSLAGGPSCNGSESGLLECVGAKNGANADTGGCALGLFIACVAEEETGVEGALRLTTTGEGDMNNDPEVGVGILEVFHAGAWGTLCNGDPARVFDYTDYGIPDDSLTEEAGLVACRQLGFETGGFRGVQRLPVDAMLRPAWLSDLACATGMEGSVSECGILEFGNTSSCGLTQRLLCINGEAEMPFLTPRLVESEADPNGQWISGRLEVFDGLAFVPISDFGGSQELGRRGVQVACRELGFATGGQMLAGSESALPFPLGTARDNRVGDIVCNGDEVALADCENASSPNRGASLNYNDYDNYGRSVEENAVALLCFNPSGCDTNDTATEAAPQQGDIRLVNLAGNDNPTQPCDNVHMGGVEFYNEGQWGRLCIARFRTRATWELDAAVVCKQLGFPFSSLMDNSERLFFGADYQNPGAERPTWASIVFCKGIEERLDECSFIEDFGRAGTDILGRPNLTEVACSDSDILSVICRRFPIKESDVIRRL